MRFFSVNRHRFRINNYDRLALPLGILDGLSRPTGSAIPYRNNEVGVIDHIAVTRVHAVGRIVTLEHSLLVALRGNVIIAG